MPKYIDYIVKMNDLSIDGFCKTHTLTVKLHVMKYLRVMMRTGRTFLARARDLDLGNLMRPSPRPKVTYVLKKDKMADVRTEKVGFARSLVRQGYDCWPPLPPPEKKKEK